MMKILEIKVNNNLKKNPYNKDLNNSNQYLNHLWILNKCKKVYRKDHCTE